MQCTNMCIKTNKLVEKCKIKVSHLTYLLNETNSKSLKLFNINKKKKKYAQNCFCVMTIFIYIYERKFERFYVDQNSFSSKISLKLPIKSRVFFLMFYPMDITRDIVLLFD